MTVTNQNNNDKKLTAYQVQEMTATIQFRILY